MGEREERASQGLERSDVPLNPFDRMNNFVRERTQGFDQLEIESLQKFGQVNIRIALLEEQRRLNKGAVDYLLGRGFLTPLSIKRVNPLEIGAWIDLLGRIANGIDKTYFKTSDMQAISEEITEFAKGRE